MEKNEYDQTLHSNMVPLSPGTWAQHILVSKQIFASLIFLIKSYSMFAKWCPKVCENKYQGNYTLNIILCIRTLRATLFQLQTVGTVVLMYNYIYICMFKYLWVQPIIWYHVHGVHHIRHIRGNPQGNYVSAIFITYAFPENYGATLPRVLSTYSFIIPVLDGRHLNL